MNLIIYKKGQTQILYRQKLLFKNCYQISLKTDGRYSAYITMYYMANQNIYTGIFFIEFHLSKN